MSNFNVNWVIFEKSISSSGIAPKLHFLLLKYEILCTDDILYKIGTDLSNAQKCTYPDPEHNTKINDFDVKWAILMLTEQLKKNRSLVQCITLYDIL